MHGTGPAVESGASLAHHGGNLDAARRRFPHAPLPWLDLSTGINPVPYRVGEIAAGAWQRLPEAAGIAALEAVAARRYGARPGETVAAPGTQALIQWLPRLLPARSVGILGLTYNEHARAWGSAGAQVAVVEELAALAGCDVAVVVNPNNPDGRLVAPADLTALAARVGMLVVDEAFMDVMAPEASLAPRLPENAVILRSFGKTYGLAGLRLGFAIAHPPLAARLREAMGPWAVGGPAVAVGMRALADDAWLAAAAARLGADALRLDALLGRGGFAIAGGTPLFRLAAHDDAAARFSHLGGRGILARPFPARPRWLRFGLPGAEEDWSRLERAL